MCTVHVSPESPELVLERELLCAERLFLVSKACEMTSLMDRIEAAIEERSLNSFATELSASLSPLAPPREFLEEELKSSILSRFRCTVDYEEGIKEDLSGKKEKEKK